MADQLISIDERRRAIIAYLRQIKHGAMQLEEVGDSKGRKMKRAPRF